MVMWEWERKSTMVMRECVSECYWEREREREREREGRKGVGEKAPPISTNFSWNFQSLVFDEFEFINFPPPLHLRRRRRRWQRTTTCHKSEPFIRHRRCSHCCNRCCRCCQMLFVRNEMMQPADQCDHITQQKRLPNFFKVP